VNVHAVILATPDRGFDVDVGLAPDDGLQHGFGGVGDDFRVDASAASAQSTTGSCGI